MQLPKPVASDAALDLDDDEDVSFRELPADNDIDMNESDIMDCDELPGDRNNNGISPDVISIFQYFPEHWPIILF